MEFWKDKDMDYKYKMVQVYKEQIEDLQKIIAEFKVANGVIHFDESSPHLHIVGVPVKDGYKNGMKKQVAKSLIFTKERLVVLQDKMRACCIKSFNREYFLDYQLKTKEKGRDEYIPVSKMQGYRELKKQQEQNKQRLAQANKKTDLLSEKTDTIEELLQNLKTSTLNKKNFVVSESSLDIIRAYIADVKDTTINIKSVNDLDVIIDNYEDNLYKYDKEVRSLKYELGEKDDKIGKLSRDLDISKNTISKQEDKITFLQTQLSRFKDLWEKVKKIFRIRIDYDKNEHFIKVADEFYEKGILNKDGTDVIKTDMPNIKKKNYELQ